MGCCGNKKSTYDVYVPISNRLLEFAKQSTEESLWNEYPSTKMYFFTFLDKNSSCEECLNKFSVMLEWFDKHGVLKSVNNNVKWILEDDMMNNHIITDLTLSASPTHLICNSIGNIVDIVTGFPDEDWLNTHFLRILQII